MTSIYQRPAMASCPVPGRNLTRRCHPRWAHLARRPDLFVCPARSVTPGCQDGEVAAAPDLTSHPSFCLMPGHRGGDVWKHKFTPTEINERVHVSFSSSIHTHTHTNTQGKPALRCRTVLCLSRWLYFPTVWLIWAPLSAFGFSVRWTGNKQEFLNCETSLSQRDDSARRGKFT